MTKRLFSLLLMLALVAGMGAQTTPEARQWLKRGEWRNGFTAAKPHKTLDAQTFMEQYQKNTAQWQTLFQWLRTTDLQAITAGRHPIPNSTLVASVEDSENGPLEKRNTESHRRKIDFQLVVSGTEGFALLDHASSTISKPYDEKKDVVRYNYVKEKTNFFDVKAGRFVIFFPTDWHIAKVQTRKKDQHLRVIVVKMDYVE
ncbi:MAG: YhcH/YjgK/YiaL family protein [Prevotella sp.]|nr:YhcH/YjgK/YiaL family protein [Prevotella sp.]